MEIIDAVAKVNSTVNGVLDIFKKRWFIALLLWAVLATQLAAMCMGRPSLEVLRGVLVDAFALDWLIPLLGGLDAALGVLARHQVLWGALYLIVVVLTFASMAAFWKDGKQSVTSLRSRSRRRT